MTCGVYVLRFNGTDRVYVGQSKNIEVRLNAHKSLARRGVHAKKLQDAFNEFSEPSIEILAECSEDMLDVTETNFITELNASTHGFNSCKVPGKGHELYGEALGNNKYSDSQIEAAFLLLVYSQQLCAYEITKLTDVSKDTIDSLSSKPRKWLMEKYPEEYKILKERSSSRFGKGKTLKERGIVYPNIVSPNGEKYNVENTSQFAKDHGLNNAHLVQVLKGKEKQHKGWKLE